MIGYFSSRWPDCPDFVSGYPIYHGFSYLPPSTGKIDIFLQSPSVNLKRGQYQAGRSFQISRTIIV